MTVSDRWLLLARPFFCYFLGEGILFGSSDAVEAALGGVLTGDQSESFSKLLLQVSITHYFRISEIAEAVFADEFVDLTVLR
jgi:hypothetical protein